jgi:hypothetical protein
MEAAVAEPLFAHAYDAWMNTCLRCMAMDKGGGRDELRRKTIAAKWG